MRITVTGRHMDLSDELKSYTNEKTSKLSRFYDRIQSVDVVFDRQAGNHTFGCEIIAKAGHQTTFVAKEQNDDPYVALDASAKEMERQLRRHKEKFRNRKHPNGLAEREPLGGPSPEDTSMS